MYSFNKANMLLFTKQLAKFVYS